MRAVTVVDLDERKGGLPCRANCGRSFRPDADTVLDIGYAAIQRNTHEETAHGYHHAVLNPPKRQFVWGKRPAMVDRG